MFLRKAKNLEIITKGFPATMREVVAGVWKNHVIHHDTYPIGTDEFFLEGRKTILVPARIHTSSYDNTASDPTERIVYDCIYSRSTDGFAREAAVKSLCAIDSLPDWVAPYLFQSLSDYVIEVSSVLARDGSVITHLWQVASRNPEQFRLTKARAISYWAAYYRREYSKDTYPALMVIRMIDPDRIIAEQHTMFLKNSLPADIYEASQHTTNNRDELMRSKKCGCYYCLYIFMPEQIVEWIQPEDMEEFPMCPRCGIDAVFGDASGYPVTEEFLQQMNRYWFDGDGQLIASSIDSTPSGS